MSAGTPLSPTTLARGGVQRDVRESSRLAKQSMEAGDLEGARAHLDKAHKLLQAAREAWPEGWEKRNRPIGGDGDGGGGGGGGSSNSSSGNNNYNDVVVDGGDPAEQSIGGLTVMVCNLESTWWWEKDDLGKAAQVLKPALSQGAQGKASNRQLAFTYSNLCAILSKVGAQARRHAGRPAGRQSYQNACQGGAAAPRREIALRCCAPARGGARSSLLSHYSHRTCPLCPSA